MKVVMTDDQNGTVLEAPFSIEIWDNPCDGPWVLPNPITIAHQVRTGPYLDILAFSATECSFTVTLNSCTPTLVNLANYWTIQNPTFTTITNSAINTFNDPRVVSIANQASISTLSDNFTNSMPGQFTLDLLL